MADVYEDLRECALSDELEGELVRIQRETLRFDANMMCARSPEAVK